MTVHFPIAFLLAAALAELLVMSGRTGLAGPGRFCLWLGALGALVSAPLGLLREETLSFAGSLHDTVELHETLGLVTAGLALASLLLREWRLHRGPGWMGAASRASLFAAAVTVSYAGHLGATLTLGPDYLPF